MAFELPSATRSSTDLQTMVVAFAAIAMLAVSATSHRWFVVDVPAAVRDLDPDASMESGFGIVSYRECSGTCDRVWTKRFIDATERLFGSRARVSLVFPAAGIVAFGCLVFGTGGLLVAIVLARAGKRLKPPVGPTTVAQLGLAISLLGALVMAWTRPEIGPLRWSIGWAWWLFVGGAVLGIASARMFARQLRADATELPAARTVS